MNLHLERAQVHLQQSRMEPAIIELRQAVLADPTDARAHGLLAICLAEQKEYEPATEEAHLAIHSDPSDWYAHFSLARVLWKRTRLPEARDAIGDAIQLEPMAVENWVVRAGVELDSRRWAEALEAAEQGLELDPEHDALVNIRAAALIKLGRQSEAGDTIDAALRRNPLDAWTHTSQGWALLEQGKSRPALEHFREALRLDPELDSARGGIVTAMKARNPFYRVILNYFLWMSKLSGGAQWGVVLGLYFGYRIVVSISRNNPELRPLLIPLIVLYIAFALTTWLADPLGNLLLRISPFGRHALSRDETWCANAVGMCFLATAVCVVAAFALGNAAVLVGAFACFLMCIPVSAIFRCDTGWPRMAMTAYTALLAGMAVLGIVGISRNDQGGSTFLGLFVLGLIASSFLANILMSSRVKH